MSDHVESNHHSGVEVAAADREGVRLTDRVRALRLPQPIETGSSFRNWIPWVLCVILAVSTGFFAMKSGTQAKEEDPKEQPVVRANGVATPAAAAGEIVLESKGYIIPAHLIQVSPKVSGMVIKLNFEEGNQFKQGDILAQLEVTDYDADRDRAAALLDAAWFRFMELHNGNRPEEIKRVKAELAEAQAQHEQLHLDWKRNMSLNRQVLAPREFEEIYSKYKAADRRVEALRQTYHLMLDGPRREQIEYAWAQVLQAEAELAKAEWRLDNCTIRAPVTGTILSKKAEQGNMVNPMAFNVSASICEMADLSDLEVDLTIQERDIATIFKGQRCKIRSEAYRDRVYEGVVDRLMPTADRAKGAIPVRVKVSVPREEEGKYLKPEMSVQVSFYRKK